VYLHGDGSSNISGSSLDLGVVNGGGSLCQQRSLVSVQLDQLCVEGCLFAGKLVVGLNCPPLNIDLLGVGSRLLFLLVSLLLIGEELPSRLRYRHSHHDCRDGLESWSVLRGWPGDDEVC
jgi:hypothetical protein